MKRFLLTLLGAGILALFTPACEMHPASESVQEHGGEATHTEDSGH